MATFTYTPDFGAARSVKPRVVSSKFGDGYEQRRPDGLNNVVEEWALTFGNRTDLEAEEILAFLEARAGFESFDWTPPLELTMKKYVCREWSKTLANHNLNTVTAKFEQVFEP